MYHIPLQSVCHYDAAEAQRFYISIGLKKPKWVLIWDLVQQIQRLNRYLQQLAPAAMSLLLLESIHVHEDHGTL